MSSFFLWVCCFTLLAQGYSKDNIAEEVIVPPVEEFDQKDIGKDLITHSSVYFFENFNDKNTLSQLWVTSKSKKETDDGSPLQYDGDWILDKPLKDSLPNDLGLTFHEKVKHRAISSKLFRDFEFSNRPFVIQYEVLHQDGQECGGAYLKLISKERDVKDLNEFNDKTPYTIMFGPDKCGTTNKLHFIFRHKNPLNGSFEEKHCKQPKTRIDEVFTDAKPHLFKLVLDPDNSYEISLDHKIVHEGSLLEDFDPPVNPPREIDDPNDKIPEDWDDRPKIPDPAAKKPENWDENEPPEIPDINAVKPADWLEDEPIHISDPSAEKPHDWDDDMDGEWEAPLVPNPACEDAPGCGPWSPPLIPNPKYKGKWSPPLIDNPNYSGVWKPRRIPNPGYFEDKFPFKMSTIDAVGFELWTISARIMFDNIIITDDENVADQFASITFDKKIINIEKSADTLFNQFVAFTNRYPWLWAVYVVVLLIPIVLVIVCCCWNNKENEAEKKKNDDLMANNYLADESSVSSSSLGATKVDQSDEDRHSRASSHVSDKAEEGSSVSNENNEEDGEDVAEEAGEAGEEVTEMAVQEERRDSDNEADISETSTEPETILKKRK